MNNKTAYLAKKAQGKNHEAFSELIHLYTADMYKVAVSILMNDEDAADAIQDAILTCWEKIHTLKQPKYFKTWLIRILIYKCYDIRKTHEKITYLEEYEEIAAEEYSNLEFKEALSVLDEKYRTIIVLYYSEGYTAKEIAELLHIPQGTVLTRMKRAREKLADYYST